MSAKTDPLALALEDLERALTARGAGPNENGPAPLDRALADIDRAVRQRHVELKSAAGRLVDVDSPLLPSPTMDRRADELRHELDGVLEEVAALRGKTTGGATEYRALRERAARLLDALVHFEHQEASLVQEAVNTDIGGGD